MKGSDYEVMTDGVGIAMEPNKMFRFACCDCGLVHDMVIATQSKKEFGIAVRRNKSATRWRRAWLAKRADK